jgi:hypothetical protein
VIIKLNRTHTNPNHTMGRSCFSTYYIPLEMGWEEHGYDTLQKSVQQESRKIATTTLQAKRQ